MDHYCCRMYDTVQPNMHRTCQNPDLRDDLPQANMISHYLLSQCTIPVEQGISFQKCTFFPELYGTFVLVDLMLPYRMTIRRQRFFQIIMLTQTGIQDLDFRDTIVVPICKISEIQSCVYLQTHNLLKMDLQPFWTTDHKSAETFA